MDLFSTFSTLVLYVAEVQCELKIRIRIRIRIKINKIRQRGMI